MCVLNKIEDANVIRFNIITGIYEWKPLVNIFHLFVNLYLNVKRVNLNKKCKEPLKQHLDKESCIYNPGVCGSDWDKICRIDGFLNNCGKHALII